nr:M13-type metalloendopeptidase [Arthrobacter roseus]
MSVRPQDDLFKHVNGTWMDNTSIPDDRPLEGSFTKLRDAAEENVKQIIVDAAGDLEDSEDESDSRHKIGRLYASFMDQETIEANGLSPVRSFLDSIDEVSDLDSLIAVSGELSSQGVAGMLAAYVSNDAGDPTRYILHLYQAALGLPDESYYRDSKFQDIRVKYEAFLEELMGLVGLEDGRRRAAAVMELETKFAAGHMDKVTCRNPQEVYNLYSTEDLESRCSAAAQWLESMGVSRGQRQEVVVCQPDFLSTLASLLRSEGLDIWRDWLRTRVLISFANYLPEPFVSSSFNFFGKELSGTPIIRDRWKRGVSLVEDAMGEAIGQEYVARHFPDGHKEKMLHLVENLLAAYREAISGLPWMTAKTQERALEKLSLFSTKIGFPELWRDYSTLEIDGDVVGNVRRAALFELHRSLGKLGQPIDRDEWLITPQTVNAYYMPTMNEIAFPAAILQPPFFDADADPAANYGGIGAVIGHEIGHGFDDQGSRFDGTGALADWWTEEDRTAFDALTSRLVAQYETLSPTATPGHRVNGELTLGENIGDLGGLTIAYAAYRLSLDGQESPVIDGLTGNQRFFFSWAECWRQIIRQEEAVRRLTIDPHSPNEFRCNAVVRNLHEFHQAFDVGPRDHLWLDPSDRVRIW